MSYNKIFGKIFECLGISVLYISMTSHKSQFKKLKPGSVTSKTLAFCEITQQSFILIADKRYTVQNNRARLKSFYLLKYSESEIAVTSTSSWPERGEAKTGIL